MYMRCDEEAAGWRQVACVERGLDDAEFKPRKVCKSCTPAQCVTARKVCNIMRLHLQNTTRPFDQVLIFFMPTSCLGKSCVGKGHLQNIRTLTFFSRGIWSGKHFQYIHIKSIKWKRFLHIGLRSMRSGSQTWART